MRGRGEEMKKIIDTVGNAGIVLFILLNLANQFLGLGGPAYSVPLFVSVVMLLPLAVRELLAFVERLRSR